MLRLAKRKLIYILGVLPVLLSYKIASAQWYKEIGDSISDSISSAFDGIVADIQSAVFGVIETIASAFLYLQFQITAVIGWLLQQIMDYTVFNYGKNYEQLSGAIETGWIFLRDISNIVFIFLILIVAISIIIGGDLFGKKKVLAQIIIVAVTMNFSLFFVKAAIDISNYSAAVVYESISIGEEKLNSQNIGKQIAGSLGLQTFFTEGDASKSILSDVISKGKPDFIKFFLLIIFASIFALTTSIALLYVCAMLLWRFIALIFILITAPIALVSTILPSGKKVWDYWMAELSTNLFFAPVFFLLLNLVLAIAHRTSTTIGASSNGSLVQLADVFSKATPKSTPTDLGVFGLVINFIIVIASLFAATYASRKISVKGSGLTASVVNKGGTYATGRMKRVVGGGTAGVAGSVGRRTLGAAGTAAARRMGGNNFVTRNIKSGLEKVGNSSFDARDNKTLSKTLGSDYGAGYKNSTDQRSKELKKKYDELGKSSIKEELAKSDFAEVSKERKSVLARYKETPENKKDSFVGDEKGRLVNKLINLREAIQKNPDDENLKNDLRNSQMELKELNEMKDIKKEMKKLVELEQLSTAGTRRQDEFKKHTLSNKTYIDHLVKNKEGEYRGKLGKIANVTLNLTGASSVINKITNKNVAGKVANNRTNKAIEDAKKDKESGKAQKDKDMLEAAKKALSEQQEDKK